MQVRDKRSLTRLCAYERKSILVLERVLETGGWSGNLGEGNLSSGGPSVLRPAQCRDWDQGYEHVPLGGRRRLCAIDALKVLDI